MNMYVSRNFEEREKLQHLVMQMELNAKEELDVIPEDISCEEYDAKANEIYEKYDTSSIRFKIFALEYKEVRNEWFSNFVRSFGECVDKKVSPKQANVFYRYTEDEHEKSYNSFGCSRYARVGDLFVEFTHGRSYGYVTIKRFR